MAQYNVNYFKIIIFTSFYNTVQQMALIISFLMLSMTRKIQHV